MSTARRALELVKAPAEHIDPPEPWASILHAAEADRPPFPSDLLPFPLNEFVKQVSESTQTPPDIAGLTSIAAAGAAIARRYEICVLGDWREPVHIWALPFIEPGQRKSAVFREVTAPHGAIEAGLRVDAEREISRRSSERRIHEKRIEQLERLIAKAARGSDDELKHQSDLNDEIRDLRSLPEIHPPTLIIDDATPEAVALSLFRNGERVALMSDEGGTFQNMLGVYSNGEAKLNVYLQGHSGDRVRVDRVGRNPITLDHPALTIAMVVQPEIMRTIGANPKFRGRGGLARFLYGFPIIPAKAQENLTPPPVRPEIRAAYADVIRFLMANAAPIAEDRSPRTLHLSAEALDTLQTFRQQINQQLTTGPLAEQPEWGNKLAGAVVRIAAIFHSVRLAQGQIEPERYPIDGETMAAACLLADDYLIPHALATFQLMGTDVKSDLIKRIIGLLEREARPSWSQRDIHNRLGSGVTRDDLKPALEHLEDCGYIRRAATDDRANRRGRRPSDVFEVNPALLDGRHASG